MKKSIYAGFSIDQSTFENINLKGISRHEHNIHKGYNKSHITELRINKKTK